MSDYAFRVSAEMDKDINERDIRIMKQNDEIETLHTRITELEHAFNSESETSTALGAYLGDAKRDNDALRAEVAKERGENKQLYDLMVTAEQRGVDKATEEYSARIAELEAEVASETRWANHYQRKCEKRGNRIAELEAAQRWAPVGERLPDGDKPHRVVEIITEEGYLTKGWCVQAGYWWVYDDSRREFHPRKASDKVAYWRELLSEFLPELKE